VSCVAGAAHRHEVLGVEQTRVDHACVGDLLSVAQLLAGELAAERPGKQVDLEGGETVARVLPPQSPAEMLGIPRLDRSDHRRTPAASWWTRRPAGASSTSSAARW
jgi:hypothetical protein